MMINGIAHGPQRATAACQLHMRHFKDGDTIFYRTLALKGLSGNQGSGGGSQCSLIGSSRQAVTSLFALARLRKPTPFRSAKKSELAMDAAACIGCGACVAACPNGSASLFTSAKISHLASVASGSARAQDRVLSMVEAMDHEGFGNCTMHRECEAVCPKSISVNFIARMNREYLRSLLKGR